MKRTATQIKRERIWIGIAIGMLALYAFFSYRSAGTQAKQLQRARVELGETQSKLGEIRKLQSTPKVAALMLEAPAEIVNRISKARQAAGLPQSSLRSQQPQAPQRIGRTDFQERITTIKLAPATMEKIIRFCEALQDDQTGTIIRDLKLASPQFGENAGVSKTGIPTTNVSEKWEAELILTQMIFSPTSG